MSRSHHLDFAPQNLFWGYFDAMTPPVLEVESGDEVVLDCLPASRPWTLPEDGVGVLPGHLEAFAAKAADQGETSHFMTGPVYVRGARPGDALQVDILEVTPIQSWGYTMIRPLLGALPDEFPVRRKLMIAIDLERRVCRLPWGRELALDPFFGVMAVAPPPGWGRISAMQPRAFGGNMDNRDLRAGATLYLPVFNDGALFSAGDGHGLQGDGEVCIAALETALTGRFRLTVRKDIEIASPYAETAAHLMSMGFHESLDAAMRRAVRNLVTLVTERTSLDREEAYMLLSLGADLKITQVVDGEKGVHMVIRKDAL